MHPAVIAIGAAAANGFGEGFGKALGNALFGGGSSDSEEIRKQLAEITKQLKVIELKLDQVLILINNLPGVIIGQFEQRLVDESYRHLEAFQAVLRNASGNIHPASQSDQALLLKSWFTVVDLESRPSLLLVIPFWTQFIRRYIFNNIDATLVERLARKIAKLNEALALSKKSLNADFEAAEVLLNRGGLFNSISVSNISPFFHFKDNPAPLLERWRGGHCEPRERYYIPDPAWPQKLASQKAQLASLRPKIETEVRYHNALFASVSLLTELSTFLNKSGAVSKSLSDEIEAATIVESIPKRDYENCQ